ncbi:MAG: hemolysin family protein, partial [Thermodesulfobacteriota bacterium]|nr:hemolysin family protein [Thermodesulfobacteriota bacterium]
MPEIVLLFFFLIVVEGFFSGSELAFISANRTKLQNEADSGDKSARLALKMLHEPEKLLSTIVTGTNLCVVTNTTVMTAYMIQQFGQKGTLYGVVLIAPLIWLFGEIVPKAVFQQASNRLVTKVVYGIWLSYYLFYPLVFLIACISWVTFKVSGTRGSYKNPITTREDLDLFLKISRDESDMRPSEKKMVSRTFSFPEKKVEEVMVHLIDVVAIRENAAISNAIELIEEKGHSRILVYKERIDNIIGLLNSFDLLAASSEMEDVRGLIRPVMYVPQSKPIDELLVELQKSGNHMAVVIGEYGGSLGIVTVEDILEEIVGEIEDEYDRGDQTIKRLFPNKYLVSARVEIEKLNEIVMTDIPEGDYETLGGFILNNIGRIPNSG